MANRRRKTWLPWTESVLAGSRRLTLGRSALAAIRRSSNRSRDIAAGRRPRSCMARSRCSGCCRPLRSGGSSCDPSGWGPRHCRSRRRSSYPGCGPVDCLPCDPSYGDDPFAKQARGVLVGAFPMLLNIQRIDSIVEGGSHSVAGAGPQVSKRATTFVREHLLNSRTK